MDFELCTDLIAKRLVEKADPGRCGACVEIGLGPGNFSFRWAEPAGFRCIAVEPLPTEGLRAACREHGVALVTAAITAQGGGPVPIYLGMFDGNASPDTNSLNPRWWGCGQETRQVESLTLAGLFHRESVATCTFLKVDTEGSECAIVEGLRDLSPEQQPAVVAFEYGGGGSRERGTGGWSGEFLEDTLASIRALRSLGYGAVIVVESAARDPRQAEMPNDGREQDLFPATALVGNLIVTREPVPIAEFAALVQSFGPELERAERRTRAAWRRVQFRHGLVRLGAGLKRRLKMLAGRH